MTSLKEKLKNGQTVIGPFMKIRDPAIMEIAGLAGFDYAIVDAEHGPISMESAENMIRAARVAGIAPIVRVRANQPELISRALDIGAEGVQIPQISTKEDAQKAVKAAKFAPEGERGVCRYVRAGRYSGMDRFAYFSEANRDTVVIVHIEGKEGIDNLQGILEVEGLDVIFIGPYDLSQSLGIPGQVSHPLLLEETERIVKLAREKQKVVGIFVDDLETGIKWKNKGVQYISYAVDTGLIYGFFSKQVKAFKELGNK
jgi:4-hydroxy-2-oxoheptanedioate aldolase